MSTSTDNPPNDTLAGLRVALAGKLSGMSKRDAQQLIRQHGGVVCEKPDAGISLIVIGEEELPLGEVVGSDDFLSTEIREAAEAGDIEIISESELWRRLGMVDLEEDHGIQRLYTTAMLANLLDVSTAVIRRWQRRGLIVPAKEVRRLAYFDFQEVSTARRLAQLLGEGISPRALEQKLESLARFLPGAKRRLDQLSIIVEGKQLLLRQGDGLVDPGGQLRFDFEADEQGLSASDDAYEDEPAILSVTADAAGSDLTDLGGLVSTDQATCGFSPEEILRRAAELEDNGELSLAAEHYRSVLVAAGPSAEVNFRLAELLYRMGDVEAARERYYMTIELDEDFVEARTI